MKRTVAIIQARYNSSRLPGKVLMKLAGRSVLEHVIRRVDQMHLIDEVVVATPAGEEGLKHFVKTLAHDKGLAHPVAWYGGPETDVLGRFYEAARQFRAEIIFRATADNPLFVPSLGDEAIKTLRLSSGVDYVSNVYPKTKHPLGLDVEAFTWEALLTATLQSASDWEASAYDREHVTPWIQRHLRFVLLTQVDDLSKVNLTLDTEEDYQRLATLFEEFGPDATAEQVLSRLK